MTKDLGSGSRDGISLRLVRYYSHTMCVGKREGLFPEGEIFTRSCSSPFPLPSVPHVGRRTSGPFDDSDDSDLLLWGCKGHQTFI